VSPEPDAAGTEPADRLRAALAAASSSARLQSALAAGTYPDPRFVPVLVDRSAVEPDFFVRDMLTWALTRHPADITVPRLIYEAGSDVAQARSQALHTLSKVGDPRGWSAITPEVLRDPDETVATTAWRTAVGLVPPEERAQLAERLASQLGRGGLQTQRSLTRSIAELADDALPAVQARATVGDRVARVHAVAMERVIRDPDEAFDTAIAEASRLVR